MKQSFLKFLERPNLRAPILIVGLPGVGTIGKTSAEFLIDELKAKKFCTLYSPHFPYHVVISQEGIIRLLSNDFFYYISKKLNNDLIILVGDSQSETLFGQYEVASLIIDLCKEYNIKKIITIGGFAIGNFSEDPKIYGAINKAELSSWIKDLGVDECEVGSPIVGAAGLLIGLASFFDIDGICLLGETPGFIKDIKSAKSILEKLMKVLDLELDLSKLDELEQSIKESIEKSQQLESQTDFLDKLKEKLAPKKKDLSYFG